MLMRYFAILFMLIASTAAEADALDINLNNNTAQFQYGTAAALNTQGNPDIHVGLLYNNANSALANLGIMVVNSQDRAPGLSIGVGVEALGAQIKDNPPFKSTASAVALDGLVRYSPPAVSQLGFVGELHYAPRIITFGDADRYMLAGARVEFELSPQTLAYVGYRRISFGIKNAPNAVLDSGFNLGIKIGF
jgi:hypothetical protein